MRELLNTRAWRLASAARERQRFIGRVSGVFLAVALLALFDGLLAQMRSGSSELELLPGEIATISGPAALKNPVNSDLVATFTPSDAPLTFVLEGFFTGYWFGNGMWRGKIEVAPEAGTGTWRLRVAFRGASATTAQNYTLKIFADSNAMRSASLSYTRLFLDINPFILAAICGASGILGGMATYYFGRRYAGFLGLLGMAEIYRATPADGSIWCLAPRSLAPMPGNARMVLDARGQPVGEARALSWHKGKLRLEMMDAATPAPGSLVCLQPVAVAESDSRKYGTATDD